MEKYNKTTDQVELWINYIQNCYWCKLPNIPKTTCLGLGGIFGLLYSLLSQIKYTNNVYLEDDSQFLASCEQPGRGLPTLPLRLFGGKQSIYETYGFIPVDEYDQLISYDQLIEKIINTPMEFKFTDGPIIDTPANSPKIILEVVFLIRIVIIMINLFELFMILIVNRILRVPCIESKRFLNV
jgi:hypothetical protein